MPRLRLDLDERTFEELARESVRELRPIPMHAELILRRHLKTEPEIDARSAHPAQLANQTTRKAVANGPA
jgi:hypothetical protein